MFCAGSFRYSRTLQANNAAFVLSDLWIDQLAAECFQAPKSTGLILAHEPAISSNIRCENGREKALDPLPAQRSPPVTRSHAHRVMAALFVGFQSAPCAAADQLRVALVYSQDSVCREGNTLEALVRNRSKVSYKLSGV